MKYEACKECGLVLASDGQDHQCGVLPEWPDVDRGEKSKRFNFSLLVPYSLMMGELKTEYTKLDHYLEKKFGVWRRRTSLVLYLHLKGLELEERWREQQ